MNPRNIRWITTMVVSVILAMWMYERLVAEDHILIEMKNLHSQSIWEGCILYFHETRNVPVIHAGEKIQVPVDIKEQSGESSVRFRYRLGTGEVREMIVIGYVEGGQTKNYRGKASVTIDQDGIAAVTFQKEIGF